MAGNPPLQLLPRCPLCLKLLSVRKCHHFVKILTCILLSLSDLLSLPQLLRLSEKRPVHSH